MDDPEFGSELRRRQTPEFAAAQRRRNYQALTLGVVMGVAVLGAALYARGHGGMVDMGPRSGFAKYPWELVAAMGVFVLVLSVWGFWRVATRRQ